MPAEDLDDYVVDSGPPVYGMAAFAVLLLGAVAFLAYAVLMRPEQTECNEQCHPYAGDISNGNCFCDKTKRVPEG